MTPLLAAEPSSLWGWLADESQRTVTGPIPQNLWTTLWHALAAGALAVALAVPLALVLAHYRKAEVVAAWLVNLGRIIPTVTILAVAVLISLRNGYGFQPWPILFALTVLAVPPIFANTYTAVLQASPDAVGSARAMGLTERQIMTGVELPLALPLILTGVRVALTQLVATEALGALFGGGGLGIYVRFGFAGDDIYQIQAGALLVAGTAMAVDLLMWLVARRAVPRGVRAPRTRRTDPRVVDPRVADLAPARTP
ncbi:MAG TPA: ABC transporter permease subunit [Aquihabitans sp.]|jgi:osmoprotectant transport system permease protein|nr:ABC transporter permease subunit [Aquihabitans sp.]